MNLRIVLSAVLALALLNPGDPKPLTELGIGKYQGYEGGLYPGGKNTRPPAHEKAGLALTKQVRPLDAEGKPDQNGKVVLLSVGMSNATQEFTAFQRLAAEHSDLHTGLTLVDGAQGGQTAAIIQSEEGPGARYWAEVDRRLEQAGATRAQVQAAWVKEADAGPAEGFPAYAQKLEGELGNVARLLARRFPNLKLVYLSSRIYAGYARSRLNPEPYAYESGFAVKWLVEKQIQGNADLTYRDHKAPWLSWGPYLWAAGTTPRADGLVWEESDFGPDGTHPSISGRRKVAEQLWRFFSTDSTTRPWFIR